MANSLTGRDLRLAILFGALVYLAIRFIAEIGDIILIFSVTGVFVMVLDTPVSWLARHKVPRRLSATLMGLAVIVLFVFTLYLVIPPASRQVHDLWNKVPGLMRDARKSLSRFTDAHPTLAPYLPASILREPEAPEHANTENERKEKLANEKLAIEEWTKSATQYVPAILGGATKAFTSAAGTILSIFLVFIATVYTLANPRPLADGFLRAVGPEFRVRLEAAGERLKAQIKAWAVGIVVAMIFIFALTWVLLLAIGMKHAFLFAVIAGLLEAVPIIGPILSAVPPIVVSLASGQPVMAVWVVVIFIAIQQVENSLLVPMIMSRQLSLHPVTVIFAVLVMGGLFGIVGVFLASPAAATIGVLFDEFCLNSREANSA